MNNIIDFMLTGRDYDSRVDFHISYSFFNPVMLKIGYDTKCLISMFSIFWANVASIVVPPKYRYLLRVDT